MIKLIDSKREIATDGKPHVLAKLYADTKAEVKSSITGADIEGLTADAVLSYGSMVFISTGEVGRLKSDGSWVWQSAVSGGGSSSDDGDGSGSSSIPGFTPDDWGDFWG